MKNYTKSSGNVFADLDLFDAEERLTQEQAAKILKVSPTKISDLLHADILPRLKPRGSEVWLLSSHLPASGTPDAPLSFLCLLEIERCHRY